MKTEIIFALLIIFAVNDTLQSKHHKSNNPKDDNWKIDKKENSEEFDLNEFLKEIDDFECNVDKTSANYDESFNQLCPKNLQKAVFKDVGEFREDGNNFWRFLNEKIYRPLAFDVSKGGSVSEMIKQLVLLSDDHTELAGMKLNPTFDSFESKVLDDFKILEVHAADENHEEISELMVNILRNFHLHWNALRLTNQLDRVKSETKNMMKRILQTYRVKEKFFFEVAKNIVDKIKLAYGNFVRAHLNHQ